MPFKGNFSLDSSDTDGVAAPDYLSTIDAFAEWLRARPEVLHVNTFTDTMKRLNKNMHADDPEYYRLPERRDLARVEELVEACFRSEDYVEGRRAFMEKRPADFQGR